MIYTPHELKKLVQPMLASGKDTDVIADVIVDDIIVEDRRAFKFELDRILSQRVEEYDYQDNHIVAIDRHTKITNDLLKDLQEAVDKLYDPPEQT